MILLTILAIAFVIAIVTGVILLGIGGGAFIIVFADIIVACLVIGLIIKRLIKKR